MMENSSIIHDPSKNITIKKKIKDSNKSNQGNPYDNVPYTKYLSFIMLRTTSKKKVLEIQTELLNVVNIRNFIST